MSYIHNLELFHHFNKIFLLLNNQNNCEFTHTLAYMTLFWHIFPSYFPFIYLFLSISLLFLFEGFYLFIYPYFFYFFLCLWGIFD